MRRRLVSLVLLLAWLAPAVVSAAFLGHELLEHGHPDPLREWSVAGALEHGHLHRGTEVDHEHPIAWSGTPELRLARVELPLPAALGSTHHDVEPPPAAQAGQAHRERTPPPRASGPALLARLALLRL